MEGAAADEQDVVRVYVAVPAAPVNKPSKKPSAPKDDIAKMGFRVYGLGLGVHLGATN